jgi:hypothetical protein
VICMEMSGNGAVTGIEASVLEVKIQLVPPHRPRRAAHLFQLVPSHRPHRTVHQAGTG